MSSLHNFCTVQYQCDIIQRIVFVSDESSHRSPSKRTLYIFLISKSQISWFFIREFMISWTFFFCLFLHVLTNKQNCYFGYIHNPNLVDWCKTKQKIIIFVDLLVYLFMWSVNCFVIHILKVIVLDQNYQSNVVSKKKTKTKTKQKPAATDQPNLNKFMFIFGFCIVITICSFTWYVELQQMTSESNMLSVCIYFFL